MFVNIAVLALMAALVMVHVAGQVTISCGVATTISSPAAATTYTLTGCASTSTTTITVAASAVLRTLYIQATAAASPCYLNGIVVQGAQSNLIVNLQGAIMQCTSSVCIDLSTATLSGVTIAAQIFSSTPTVSNTFSSTANGIITANSGSNFYVQLDSSTITSATDLMRITGAITALTIRGTSSTMNSGGSFLSALSTLSNVDIRFNSANLAATTTTISSTSNMFQFTGAVTSPFFVYSGPGTTMTGGASAALINLANAGLTTNPTISITNTALRFSSTTTCLICTAGSVSQLTLSVYGTTSTVTTAGHLVSITGSLDTSTISLSYAATSSISKNHLYVSSYISVLSASFLSASLFTSSGLIYAGVLTSVGISCSAIAASAGLVSMAGTGSSTLITLDGTNCGGAGPYVSSVTTVSVTSLSVSLTSSGLTLATGAAFYFGGALSSSSITLTSTSITAQYLLQCASFASSLLVSTTSSTFVTTTLDVFAFQSATLGSSSIAISTTSSSTFSGVNFISFAFDINTMRLTLDTSSKITASGSVLAATGANVQLFTVSIGTSSTITANSIGFKAATLSSLGLLFAASGAKYIHSSSLALISVLGNNIDTQISIITGTTLSSPGSTLFTSAGLQTTDLFLTMAGGSLTAGQFASIGALASSITFTASSNAVASFTNPIFSSSSTVTGLTIRFTDSTITAGGGVLQLTSTGNTHQGVTFIATNLGAGSSFAASYLITCAATLSVASISLNSAALTISTTQNMFDVWSFINSGITVTGGLTLKSQLTWLKTMSTGLTVSILSSSTISSGSDVISLGGSTGFTFVGSSSAISSSARVLTVEAVSSTITFSTSGCTLTAATSSATTGAFLFSTTVSNVNVDLQTTTSSFPTSSFLHFTALLSGTSSLTVSSGSINGPSGSLVQLDNGFTGTMNMYLLSGVTVTVQDQVWNALHQNSASGSGNVISISSATITISTSTASSSPSVVYVANAPTLAGVSWTITNTAITHLIPITPSNAVILSFFTSIASMISITNSVGPAFYVQSTSVTSSSAALSTFLGIRLEGAGSLEGHANPLGVILYEQLTYSLSTDVIALVSSSTNYAMNYMSITCRCVTLTTTSMSPFNILGLANQLTVSMVGMNFKNTLAVVPFLNLPTSTNQYMKITFQNSYIHAPQLIALDASLLVANPTPSSVIQINVGCSWASSGYAMSPGSFGSPLYSAFTLATCVPNPLLNCMHTKTRSYSETLSPMPTLTESSSVAGSPSVSPSSDPSKTWVRTPSNETTISNSSQLSVTPSQTRDRTLSTSKSREQTLSDSVTESPTFSASESETRVHSKTNTITSTMSPTGTTTGTLSETLGPPTLSVVLTPSDTTSSTFTPTKEDSSSRSTSETFSTSLSTTYSEDPSVSRSGSRTSTVTSSYSEDVSLTRSYGSKSITPSGSFTRDISWSKSESESLSLSFSGSPTEVRQSKTRSASPTLSASNDPTLSRSTSVTLSPTDTTSISTSYTDSPTAQLSETGSKGTRTQTPSSSESPTVSTSFSGSDSFSAIRSTSHTRSQTTSSTPTDDLSRSASSTMTLSQSESATVTVTTTRTHTLSPSPSESPTSSFASLSAMATSTRSISSVRSVSVDSATFSDTRTVSPMPSSTPSESITITQTEVTASAARSASETETFTSTRSKRTADLSLTRTITMTSSTSKSGTRDVTVTMFTTTLSVSPGQASVTASGTASWTRTFSRTVTLTEGSPTGSVTSDVTFTAMTRNVTPSRETRTVSISLSLATQQLSKSRSFTHKTASRSIHSVTVPQSASTTNSSSPSEDSSVSRSQSKDIHTITESYTLSSDITLTVTKTFTPPKTISGSRSVTPPIPGAPSNLQVAVNFFGDFFGNGQKCTVALWYVIAICAILVIIEAVLIGLGHLMGDCLERHPETSDQVGVLRSLVVRSTYLSVLIPCHARCALVHSLVAVLHISLVIALYYTASVRLYLTEASPLSLKVIVALSCATVPHAITHPVRQLMFYYRFNTRKLEKAWLRYTDITGRHKSRSYFPTVTNDAPLQTVLNLSKTKLDAHDAELAYYRGRPGYEQRRQQQRDEDTFEFDMDLPITTTTNKGAGRQGGGKVIRVMSMKKPTTSDDGGAAATTVKDPLSITAPASGGGATAATSTSAIGVAASSSRGKPDIDHDTSEDDEEPVITVITTDSDPVTNGGGTTTRKKKKKTGKEGGGKKKKKDKTRSNKDAGQKNLNADAAMFGQIWDSESEDDHVASPAEKRTSTKPPVKGVTSSPASSPKKGSNKNNTTEESYDNSSERGADISSIDMNVIFSAAWNEPSGSLGGSSKPSSREKGGVGGKGDDDVASLVPSIMITAPIIKSGGALVEEYNLDLSFSDIATDDALPTEDVALPMEDMQSLVEPQRDTFALFDTPQATPSLAAQTPPPVPTGKSAFKALHGIEDPFNVSSSSSDDDHGKKFKKASGKRALLAEHDPRGFAQVVNRLTETPTAAVDVDFEGGVSVGGLPPRRGSSSFRLHPLKDARTAVVEGAITNKVVQHNLEDRWEKRSDEWSLPSTSDSTDTEGDDEEGLEYFPAPIITYHLFTALGVIVLIAGVWIAFFFTIRGISQPDQLCVTNLVYVTFLVDFLVVESVVALLSLFHRIWWFDQDGSHDRRSEKSGWRTAIKSMDCTLHPFHGEFKEHLIPPLKKGKRRRVKDQQYQFGLPVKDQPEMEVPKPFSSPHKTRLSKWE